MNYNNVMIIFKIYIFFQFFNKYIHLDSKQNKNNLNYLVYFFNHYFISL